MYIKGMTVGPSSHPAFAQNLDLEFDERVNLFIGSNACGKSSLLRVLADSGLVDDTAIYPFSPVRVKVSEDWLPRVEKATNGGFDDYSVNFAKDKALALLPLIPWIYIPATRIILPSELDWGDRVTTSKELEASSQENPTRIEWQDNARIFDGRWVEQHLKKLFNDLKNRENRDLNKLVSAERLAYECAKAVSREVLQGRAINYVSHQQEMISSEYEGYDPLFVEPEVHPGMGVHTKSGENGKVKEQYAGDLSAGTQGVYLWVLYLALKIMWHYEFEPHLLADEDGRWHEKPAILLIDEIENHLHPTWQRRVIPALLEHFPGLQIFATTHSPFVVAGLKAGQVHVLKRDENGVVTASTNKQDVVGWTMDEVLRTLMGVDDPTDDETARAASELRQLRREGPLRNHEQEEKRQERIQELRQKVDRDLLAGGPMEAQRELFEQQFSEALENYRRSQDLEQENH